MGSMKAALVGGGKIRLYVLNDHSVKTRTAGARRRIALHGVVRGLVGSVLFIKCMESDKTFDVVVHQLLEDAEQHRRELVRTELDLCHTLAGVAESEISLGDRDHAARAFARAAHGYVQIHSLIEQGRSWGESVTNDIAEELADLRQDLNRVQHLIQPPSGAC